MNRLLNFNIMCKNIYGSLNLSGKYVQKNLSDKQIVYT